MTFQFQRSQHVPRHRRLSWREWQDRFLAKWNCTFLREWSR